MIRKPKPTGWQGNKNSIFYTNDRSKYGRRYMCAYCGRKSLGISDWMHFSKCPVKLAQISEKGGKEECLKDCAI